MHFDFFIHKILTNGEKKHIKNVIEVLLKKNTTAVVNVVKWDCEVLALVFKGKKKKILKVCDCTSVNIAAAFPKC